MSSNNPYVIDATLETFESEVLQAPDNVTVLADFWAPWCAPCRQLGPVLEKLAASYSGRVKIVKINTDENEELSMHFGIQGIPAVKVFQQGKLIHEFTGALPEFQIRQILDQFVSSETDDIASQGLEWLKEGQTEKAKQCFENAFTIDPDNKKAMLGLAQIAVQEGDWEKAEHMAGAIEITDQEYEEAQGIVNRLEFVKESKASGGSEACAERLRDDECNLDVRYALACCLAAEQKYQESLEEFLAVIKKNKNYRDGAAKRAMVKVFSIIGQRSALADEYRDKLEWILY
ncbi:MAG: thioredoxin [Candidatus Omnitrophica bacterium]|nr:thioredoxin [Candidatus Omnitrophota bacterium]